MDSEQRLQKEQKELEKRILKRGKIKYLKFFFFFLHHRSKCINCIFGQCLKRPVCVDLQLDKNETGK